MLIGDNGSVSVRVGWLVLISPALGSGSGDSLCSGRVHWAPLKLYNAIRLAREAFTC